MYETTLRTPCKLVWGVGKISQILPNLKKNSKAHIIAGFSYLVADT